jgi:lipopolysaccharide/colanic/teichoic acid biosynthesis glycosyltransferase
VIVHCDGEDVARGFMAHSRVKAEEEGATILSPCLSEGYFRGAITLERKRTERSGLAIMLLLISVGESVRKTDPLETWKGLADALAAVSSEIDMLGWFEQGTVMGLLASDIPPSELAAVSKAVEEKFRKELTGRFEPEITDSVIIRLRVYPESLRSEEEASQSIDSYLYPELHESRMWVMGYEPVKRGLDILGSFMLLVLLSPLLAAIALSVKLTSSGPIIFRQVRIGQMMKPFMICKFRTMLANADPSIHHNYVSWFIMASDKAEGHDKKQVFKLTSDPRVTPIGQFLRKTSLDELPQLWNVLKGEMSLVGPRPPLWYELQQYKPWHRHRVLEVKPGITGLWQVSGRSRTTFDEMVRLDLRYAKTRSLWSDIKILLATPKAVISGKGAC